MKHIKGDRLYVNLGASQVRRRLKGHGFGVRKVESAGTGRAVIIHTATGQHLRELQALFRDVLPAAAEKQRAEETEFGCDDEASASVENKSADRFTTPPDDAG